MYFQKNFYYTYYKILCSFYEHYLMQIQNKTNN